MRISRGGSGRRAARLLLLLVGAGAPTAARPLGCSPAHLAVPHIPRHAGGVEAAVEAATGGAGAGAPTAAEWDDRGELDYTSSGSSPAQNWVFNHERYTRHS